MLVNYNLLCTYIPEHLSPQKKKKKKNPEQSLIESKISKTNFGNLSTTGSVTRELDQQLTNKFRLMARESLMDH